MNETRRNRIQAAILEEISFLVSREIKDPRIGNLTITKVVVTPDAAAATIYFLPFGDTDPSKEKIDEYCEGLKSAQGYMRRHLSKVLKLRHIPDLQFKADRGLVNTQRVSELLKQIESEKPQTEKTSSE